LSVSLPAHCRLGEDHRRDPLSDISLGGFYLKTTARAAVGTPVRVALALPLTDGLRFCTLVGSVVRVDEDEGGTVRGLGVALNNRLDRFDGEILQGFISLWSSTR
jgi:hypothetical protein